MFISFCGGLIQVCLNLMYILFGYAMQNGFCWAVHQAVGGSHCCWFYSVIVSVAVVLLLLLLLLTAVVLKLLWLWVYVVSDTQETL